MGIVIMCLFIKSVDGFVEFIAVFSVSERINQSGRATVDKIQGEIAGEIIMFSAGE
jgi:hypothetical protein